MAVRPKAKAAASRSRTRPQQPVCIVLKDGSYYVGWIEGVQGGELTLSGVRGTDRWNPQSARKCWEKAKVSALGAATETAAAAQPAASGVGATTGGLLGGLGGLDDLMGFMQKALPIMKMGMDMIKTIMPLMGGLKL